MFWKKKKKPSEEEVAEEETATDTTEETTETAETDEKIAEDEVTETESDTTDKVEDTEESTESDDQTESTATESESKNDKKKKKKRNKKKFNPLGAIIYWFWGDGPPTRYHCHENPFGAYTLRAKFKRWFYIHHRGYCYSITTMYDKPNDVYLYDRDIIPRKELSDDSVHVTNEKFTNHLDLDHPKRGFDARMDNGFTAHDAFMYIKCNKIDEAMKIELGEPSNKDYKKILFITIGCFVAFFIFYMMYMQR